MSWSVILATIAVLILVKSLVLLAAPRAMKKMTLWFVKDEQRLRLSACASGAVGIVLGLIAVVLS